MPNNLIDDNIAQNITPRQVIDLATEQLNSQRVENGGFEGANKNALIDRYIGQLNNESVMTTLTVLHDMAARGDKSNALIAAKINGVEELFKLYEMKYSEAYETEKTKEEELAATKQQYEQQLTNQITGTADTNYYIPSIGAQVSTGNTNSMQQSNPLLKMYSPRLLGAPPQLTNTCDMRLLSSYDEDHYGPVGDFYLTKILQDAQICNIFVGRARFTGGVGSFLGILNQAKNYLKALSTYNIYEANSDNALPVPLVEQEAAFETYNSAMGEPETYDEFALMSAAEAGYTDIDPDAQVGYITGESKDILNSIGEKFIVGGATLVAQLTTSLSVQQPFYTFESDWYTYINNVKMMINTAVIMLGLQDAPVRIGDELRSISMSAKFENSKDVWSNYRYITPDHGLGVVTERDSINGSTSQYISLMVDPSSFTETYNNNVGDSQLFGAMKQGQSVGNEIAFLTNSSVNQIDDMVINLAQKGTDLAQKVITSLSAGTGRFAAAVVGGFAKSFTGDHTIYPQIWQDSNSTQSVSFTIHLVSDGGDPYSYLINILVPLFYIMGAALPKLSRNNAAAYSFPPVIQANIPGLWGTRLGMITSLTVTKNPNGGDVSINGYPLAVDVQLTIADLQHVLMTSPMDEISTFLNNNTMFDYIAQMCGCDKYRVNPAVRLVSKLALASSAVRGTLNNIGNAIMSGANTWMNRKFGYSSV
jgi:pyridoxine 5'-phosphate synthase PdxJ